MSDNEQDKHGASTTPASHADVNAAKLPRFYSTDTLFADANEILIQHQEEIYRLRITRNRKLILTK